MKIRIEYRPAFEIKKIRKRLGLSRAEFAGLLGVSRFVVTNWESGATIPRADRFLLAQELEKKIIGSLSGGMVNEVSEGLSPNLEG
jgi:transcriptional regulator with XRE-family HTH domain